MGRAVRPRNMPRVPRGGRDATSRARSLHYNSAVTSRRPTRRYAAFAVTAPGLADVAARELRDLGIGVDAVDGAGVAFEADFRTLAAANLQLRTVSRILVRVDEFRAATFHELEKRTARISWGDWLTPGRDVSLRVTCRKSRLYHSGAVAERVAGALAPFAGRVDAGDASHDESHEAGDAQRLVVRLLHDRCTISLDSSGALLHQRGYRLATARAPMRETLGAALLLVSGWVPGTPLVDPFCGAGTLAIEGAMLARRMAPGRSRDFALSAWPGADPSILAHLRHEARERERPAAGGPIFASDRDAGAIDAARANAERAGVAGDITFAVQSVSQLVAPGRAPVVAPEGARDGTAEGAPGGTPEGARTGAVVTNPPYGVRVGEGGDLRSLYARTGVVLRRSFVGWRLAMVAADRTLTGQLGIALRDVVQTSNGGLPVRFAVGEIEGAP